MYIPFQTISNDIEAEELIGRIAEAQAEHDRLVDVCKAQIEKYQNKIADYDQMHEDDIKYARIMLGEYCRLHATKTTKTTQTYKLPSGTLKWLHKAPSVVRDDSKLLDWIKSYCPQLVRVQTKETPAWDELKKELSVVDNHYEYVDGNGEIVPVDGVELVAREDEFVIE
jgi:phage host-nuclease inhibitor protein Gam